MLPLNVKFLLPLSFPRHQREIKPDLQEVTQLVITKFKEAFTFVSLLHSLLFTHKVGFASKIPREFSVDICFEARNVGSRM